MEDYPVTELNKVKRSPSRGKYDRQSVFEILDAGFICHVGFVDNGQPFIIPMSYGRHGNSLYLHGASSSRIMNRLCTTPICVTVTFIDGLVFARSMFDTSVNYRSVVMFGTAEEVKEHEKLDGLKCISEYIIPGRWEEVRLPSPNELKATTLLKFEITTASAKVRSGPPQDDAQDLDLPIWAGVVPLKTMASTPLNDPALKQELPLPQSAKSILTKYPYNN